VFRRAKARTIELPIDLAIPRTKALRVMPRRALPVLDTDRTHGSGKGHDVEGGTNGGDRSKGGRRGRAHRRAVIAARPWATAWEVEI
jgi:hypothetical protein